MTLSRNLISKNGLFSSPVFGQAIAEIESLGFRVSDSSEQGSTPYMVIGGRSNPRWWLVPLTNRRVTISGMALFQPILTSAKIIKRAAEVASVLGLSAYFPQKKVYIAGESRLAGIFGEQGLQCAFFTGTNSPHRKVAVQVMDQDGNIKGFAKISHNPAVSPLLSHEAETLNYLQTLDLKTAIVPKVLFCGEIGGASIMVTDTLKTAKTKTTTTLSEMHISFLHELSQKTACSNAAGNGKMIAELRGRYESVEGKLPADWQRRLTKAIDRLAGYKDDLGPWSLSHGDFTPWNTFCVDDRLYVFDWEYAQKGYPASYDIIHFIVSLAAVKTQSVSEAILKVQKLLRELMLISEATHANILFLCYLCIHSLHYISREADAVGKVLMWDGDRDAAAFIDSIIG